MRLYVMPLITADHRNRNIAILDKAPPMRSSAEALTKACRCLHPILIRPVPGRFTKQAQRFAHLGFGFIDLPGAIVGLRLR